MVWIYRAFFEPGTGGNKRETEHEQGLWLLRRALRERYGIGCGEGRMPELVEGAHGKPYLKEYPLIHFNISHSGVYGACALSFIPCGLDIQEVRKVRSRKMLERVLSREEQELVQKAQKPEVEFCRFWARKESFLKLSGDGITRSMRDLEQPGWYQEFQVDSQVLGCICAGEHFQVSIQQVPQEKFFQRFLV